MIQVVKQARRLQGFEDFTELEVEISDLLNNYVDTKLQNVIGEQIFYFIPMSRI